MDLRSLLRQSHKLVDRNSGPVTASIPTGSKATSPACAAWSLVSTTLSRTNTLVSMPTMPRGSKTTARKATRRWPTAPCATRCSRRSAGSLRALAEGGLITTVRNVITVHIGIFFQEQYIERMGSRRATYRFAPDKAFAAIQFMVSQTGRLDLHTALKACYFADRSHLNEYQQPIFGATYRAMKYGPVPLEIYEILKGESLWLSELGIDSLPWHLEGYRIVGTGPAPQCLDMFSESEREHLVAGFEKSSGMTFTSRTAATHGPDWQAADGGIMCYEDMVDEGPKKEAAITYIQETARHIRL